jgi:aconitate hydratase
MFYTPESQDPVYTELEQIDHSTIEPSMSGPKRPQD